MRKIDLPLNEQRQEICDWISDYEDHHKYAPNVRELAAAFDRSVVTMHMQLQKMKESGLVDWKPGESRTLHVV